MVATLSTLPLDRPVGQLLQPTSGGLAGITLRQRWTIDESVAHLRTAAAEHAGGGQVLYFYVLDDDDRLAGVISTRRLLLSPPQTPLATLLNRNLVLLRDTDTLFDACELFAMHRLLAIPVVDAGRKLLGTLDVSVYTDEVIDLAEQQSAREIFQLIGLHLAQVKNASALAGYRLRMPWLLANIAGGTLCAVLASFFDQVLQDVLLLSLFIPIMLTLSESVSIQSMTLALQSTSGRAFSRSVFRELATAVPLGFSAGLLVMLLALCWGYPAAAPALIGVSIAINMLLSAALGNLLPKLIARLRLNPMVASGPLVLACADILSITIYLSMATLLLRK